MTDQGWVKVVRFSRHMNGCTLSVGEHPEGGFRWSVNRYPDVHETGRSDSLTKAMFAAVEFAQGQ